MLTLTHIEASNFGVYKKLDLDVPPGITAIVGPNGIGKSTLTEIVRFCLTGNVTGTKKDVLREGTSKGYGKIHFTLHNKEGWIYKELHSSTADMEYAGESASGVEDVTRLLLTALEVEKQTIDDVVLAPQGELDAILTRRASEREKMFQVIFGLERMPRIERAISNELSQVGVVDNLHTMYSAIQAEITEVETSIQKVAEEKRVFLSTPIEDINTLQEEYTQAQKVVTLFQDLVTLKRQIQVTQQQLDSHKASPPTSDEEIDSVKKVLDEVKTEAARLDAQCIQLTRTIRLLSENTTANCPVCKHPLDNPQELITSYTSAVDTCSTRLTEYKKDRIPSLHQKVCTLEHRQHDYTSRISQLEYQLKSQETRVHEICSKLGNTQVPNLDLIKRRLQVAIQRKEDISRTSTRLSVLEERRDSLLQRFHDLETMTRQAGKIQEYINILTPCKTAFHYTALPRQAASYYLESLNVLTNKYLGWFPYTFSAVITPSYEIKCDTGTTERKVVRLSGGQKTVFAISLRLALHEMFTSNFGFLWLDEPTAFLDTDNISIFCDTLDSLRAAITTELGMQQLAVITHHTEVATKADQVIDVRELIK